MRVISGVSVLGAALHAEKCPAVNACRKRKSFACSGSPGFVCLEKSTVPLLGTPSILHAYNPGLNASFPTSSRRRRRPPFYRLMRSSEHVSLLHTRHQMFLWIILTNHNSPLGSSVTRLRSWWTLSLQPGAPRIWWRRWTQLEQKLTVKLLQYHEIK